MDHRRFLFGCLLALGSVGAAAAMDVDARGLTGAQRSAIDSSNPGGTVAPPSNGRDGSSASCPASPAVDGSDGSGLDDAHPQARHHENLGWQSLLPGSIQ